MRIRAALIALALLAGELLVAPMLPEPATANQFRIWAYGSHALFFGTLCAAVALLVTVRTARLNWLITAVAITFAASLLLNVLRVEVASDLTKVAFGSLAGIALSRAIERAWWLVPICICVPLADAWSVFSSNGVTHAVVEHAQRDRTWIDWPTIATPIAGLQYGSFGRIGIVDVLFAAVFLAAASRWRLGLPRCAALLSVGFVATSVLVFEEVAPAVPALPLLCLAFLSGAAPGLWHDLRAATRGH